MLPPMPPPTANPANDTTVDGARSAWAGPALALVVLVASLLLVWLYWRSAHEREMQAARMEFTARADESTALLSQRLGEYELVARGGVSLFASVARPSRRQWQDYVDALNLGERYPALSGLGFATYGTPHQLAALQQLLRDSGDGLFSVHPRGVREHYGAVLYLEPRTPANADAIGEDMYADPVRHAAMQAARDTGMPRLSGPVPAIGAGADQDAPADTMMLVLPVYRFGDRPDTIAARRVSMQGWVHVEFRPATWVRHTLRNTPHRLSLDIVDATGGTARPLYSDPGGDASPAFTSRTTLAAFGRDLQLTYASAPAAAITAGMTNLRITVAVGVLASLLLFLVALVLARTHLRAERLAARMTESYRRSELRFRSAMEFSAIGKALLDHQGRIVDANPAMARILGKHREQLAGTAFDAWFLEGDGDEARRRQRTGAGDGGVYRSTRSLLSDTGGLRQVQMTFAPVPGDVGEDIARLVQVEDVTDRLRAEAQVLALNRTLEARVEARTRELTIANQDLESFAYSVSHDLRAPLRAIDGFSRLLLERHGDAIGEEGRGHLERVRKAAARMGSLIESLLKMARLGRGGLKPAPLDLSRMAAEVVADLAANDPERAVDVAIEPGLSAVGDPSLVRNLLQNLLANAWKFTRDEPDPRIQVGRDGDEFFVRDNGAGFPAEYANKLFRPFQRLHAAEQFDGDGIGLASVKRIIERHGGTIRAEGEVGRGATFRFTLPEAPRADA
jgi:PAS domain S-box-containing protein